MKTGIHNNCIRLNDKFNKFEMIMFVILMSYYDHLECALETKQTKSHVSVEKIKGNCNSVIVKQVAIAKL